MMAGIPLRDVSPGTRFVLLRTGQRFRFLGVSIERGKTRLNVKREGDGADTYLNHQCIVLPIIKPRIRIKAISE